MNKWSITIHQNLEPGKTAQDRQTQLWRTLKTCTNSGRWCDDRFALPRSPSVKSRMSFTRAGLATSFVSVSSALETVWSSGPTTTGPDQCAKMKVSSTSHEHTSLVMDARHSGHEMVLFFLRGDQATIPLSTSGRWSNKCREQKGERRNRMFSKVSGEEVWIEDAKDATVEEETMQRPTCPTWKKQRSFFVKFAR